MFIMAHMLLSYLIFFIPSLLNLIPLCVSNGKDEKGEELDEEGVTEEKDDDRERDGEGDRDRDRDQARKEEGSGIGVLRRIARLASAFLKVTDFGSYILYPALFCQAIDATLANCHSVPLPA